jgi:heterodisulfide reductase subunit A-like polyferredoxin
MTEVLEVKGKPGNLKVRIRENPRYIDIKKCTACDECAKACPVDIPNGFDGGLSDRKAAYKLYPQAMPSGYAIQKRGTAPCKATCPAHVSIQGYIALIHQGKYREALELFKEAHPFPAICGRVCHHPCEGICTRGDLDEPVAMQYLHRFLADLDLDAENRFAPKSKEPRQEKVAIVGAGPAGLAAAYFLAKQGYPSTVFERLPLAGGMMAVGIPEYRLPKKILASEVQVIRDMGVEIKTGVEFGKVLTLSDLKKEGYRALFLATGLHLGRRLKVEGEDLPGTLNGVEFLRDVALGRPVELGKEVMVIGGGNVAIDVALSARRKGAQKITLVCLEKREEMPAWDYEVEEAIEEGITIVNSLGPKRFIEKDGKVIGAEFKRCTSVFDEKKVFNPKYDESDVRTMRAETIIVAIGQAGDLSFAGKEGIPVTPRGGLQADPVTLQTPLEWVFAGGDALYGPKSVVEAVACGKEAAESIHRFLNGLDLKEGRAQTWDYEKPDLTGQAKIPRTRMRKIPPQEREGNFKEIALGFSEEEVKEEAWRCLKCGICSECYQCVTACLAGAVDHSMKPKERVIEVGSIILAPGFQPFDPSGYDRYAYHHPNVVTTLEFERMLSPGGPFKGHITRHSDGKEPKKIAWIQCVGSRSEKDGFRSYCSNFCCMASLKQTMIAKEHIGPDLDTAVFFMDMRTPRKDFEKYYERAKDLGGRLIRSRVHSVLPRSDTGDLFLNYVTESGESKAETFEMVVLSVGLMISPETEELAERLGVRLDLNKFVSASCFEPVATSRPGVYACGVFTGPKDIPQTVMEGSAAAAQATRKLALARGTLLKEKCYPPEKNVSGQPPRVGVFVCHCGINIGGVADVPAIAEYVRTIANVEYVQENLFSCSEDAQKQMAEKIREQDLNRVIVAACTPSSHQPIFRDMLRTAGLNQYLFEMANIRNQCTWVHQNEPEKATQKAKDLIRMAVAKARLIEPLDYITVPINRKVLVIGGGVAGMTSAVTLADHGYYVDLVERKDRLGGNALKLHTSWRQEKIRPFVYELIAQVENHDRITVHFENIVVGVEGIVGNFTSRLSNGMEIKHGTVIVCIGAEPLRPEGQYLYKKHPNVLLSLDLDRELARHSQRVQGAEAVAFIQCVGSRIPERPYCNKVCCAHSVENALRLKDMDPDMDVYIIYRDMRTYGQREDLYTEARRKGVLFFRYDVDDPPQVDYHGDRIKITLTDHVLKRKVELVVDLLTLATAIIPHQNAPLAELYKIPLNAEGFFTEAHAKIRPVDTTSEGIFLAGLCHYPKPIQESIAEGLAAASRANTILSKTQLELDSTISHPIDENCDGCAFCVDACPFRAITLIEYIRQGAVKKTVDVDETVCKGCGSCMATCPKKGIYVSGFSLEQLGAQVDAALGII